VTSLRTWYHYTTMYRFNLSISDNEHEKLRQLAFERRVTIAKLVREAIDATYGTNDDEIPAPGRKAERKD
jgi:hypothetical protein